MKVSVVVPVYNAAPYLPDCLESLAAQEMGDFEALLMDDGSSDGSAAIAAHWAGKDARFALHTLPHGGVSLARNAGVELARGEYLFFLDADDLLPLFALELLLQNAGNWDIVCAFHEERDPDGTTRLYAPDLPPDPPGRVVRRILQGDSVYNITCNKLYRRGFWREQGLRYDPALAIGEDALVNLRAFAGAKSAALVSRVTYTYRVHPASAMRARAGEYDRHLPMLRAMGAALREMNLWTACRWQWLAALALRYAKQYGWGQTLRAFGAEMKKESPQWHPAWYPAYFVLTSPVRRLLWKGREWRATKNR